MIHAPTSPPPKADATVPGSAALSQPYFFFPPEPDFCVAVTEENGDGEEVAAGFLSAFGLRFSLLLLCSLATVSPSC